MLQSRPAEDSIVKMVTPSSQHATARHGNERRNTPLNALLAEWHRLGPTIETGLVGQRFTGPNIAADLICHGAYRLGPFT